MPIGKIIRRRLAQLTVLLLCGLSVAAQSVSVTTQHNDNARNGADLQEAVSSVGTVEGACNADGLKFGWRFDLPVQDEMGRENNEGEEKGVVLRLALFSTFSPGFLEWIDSNRDL